MNDPHVKSLTYRITKADTVDFDKAAPLEVLPEEVPDQAFRVTVDNYRATVTLIAHFASVGAARAAVEQFLHTWEFWDDLNEQNGLRFDYANADVEDRDPTPGSATVYAGRGTARAQGRSVTVHMSWHRWPDPPKGIDLSDNAKYMHQRWLAYCQGRELLTSAAYVALTELEKTAQVETGASRKKKKRQSAGAYYNIEEEVLKTLGYLTTAKGGTEARKAEGRNAPLSPIEQNWVKAAFRALILRTAERAYHSSPPPRRLTMAELPELRPGQGT